MKIQTIRNTKGEVVATFETEEEGAVAPTMMQKRGFTSHAVEVKADYSKDPGALYEKLNRR